MLYLNSSQGPVKMGSKQKSRSSPTTLTSQATLEDDGGLAVQQPHPEASPSVATSPTPTSPDPALLEKLAQLEASNEELNLRLQELGGDTGHEVIVARPDPAELSKLTMMVTKKDERILELQQALERQIQYTQQYQTQVEELWEKEGKKKLEMQQRIQTLENELLQLKSEENPPPIGRQNSFLSQVSMRCRDSAGF